jgi:hypothetical protein
MFFDYPADKKTLDYILEKSEPKGLHFMNYEPKFFDEQGLVQTFNGMLKYASHNNNGKVELVRCASALSKSVQVITKLMDLYEELGFIKIRDKNSAFYDVEFISFDGGFKILNNEKFAGIFELSLACEEFQKSLLEDRLEDIV